MSVPTVKVSMPTPTVLYSANTWLAYLISKTYYQNEHWVWCSPHFDARGIANRDNPNPPSATPGDIYEELRRATSRGDRHSAKIAANRVGLLKGVVHKKEAGIIDEDQAKAIVSIIELAQVIDFRPLMYVIPVTEEITGILKAVDIELRAHPLSNEYIIERLPRRLFDIIEP